MTKTVETITEYIRNYPKTTSTEMDSKIRLFKSDVYTMSQELEKGELWIYSKDDYIEMLEEDLENCDDEVSEKELTNQLEVVKDSDAIIFIESTNSTGYCEVFNG